MNTTPTPERLAALSAGTAYATAEELAHVLGVSARFVQAQANSRGIPAMRVGRLYRFHLPTILAAKTVAARPRKLRVLKGGVAA